jgi:hypothetical protein
MCAPIFLRKFLGRVLLSIDYHLSFTSLLLWPEVAISATHVNWPSSKPMLRTRHLARALPPLTRAPLLLGGVRQLVANSARGCAAPSQRGRVWPTADERGVRRVEAGEWRAAQLAERPLARHGAHIEAVDTWSGFGFRFGLGFKP